MGRHRLRRLTWGLTDQGAGSLTTLVLSVGVLRGPTDGSAEFALVFLLHSLAVGFCRSITTEPVAQDLPLYTEDQVRRHVRVAGLTGVGVGLLSAVLCALLVRPDTAVGLWSLAFTLGVVPTDSIRAAWIGARRTPRAVPFSVAQLLAAATGLVVVLVTGSDGWVLAPVALVSGALTVLSVLAGPAVDRSALRPRHWVYAAEWSFTSGLAQSSGLVVTGLGLPLLPLLVRAQGVLFGPLSTLIQAVAALAVPEFATTRRPRLLRPALALSLGLMALCTLYSAVVLVVPDAVPAALLGNAWNSFAPVVPAAAAAIVGGALSMGPLVALRAHGAARSSLGARVVIGIGRLLLPVAGALIWGPPGFFWAAALAGVLGGAWAVVALRRVEREQPEPRRPEPVGERS